MIEMDFCKCADDITIAQKVLNDSLLLSTVTDKTRICDVYCLPSHNYQAFYLQVYKDEKEWILIYAKPVIDDEVVMWTFADAVKADKHIAHKGDIYCGMKRVPITNTTINELVSNLPLQNEVQSSKKIIIDGITTYIKNYKCDPAAVLFFYDEKSLPDKLYSKKQKEFLGNLYLHIEEIISNLYKTNT